MEITIPKNSKIHWLLFQRVIYYIQTDKQVCKENVNTIYNIKACPRSQLNGGEKYWKFIPCSRPPKSWQLARWQSGNGFGTERFRAIRLGVSGASPTRTSRRCSQKTERRWKQWQFVANVIIQFARVRFASLVRKSASKNHSAGQRVCTRVMWLFAC